MANTRKRKRSKGGDQITITIDRRTAQQLAKAKKSLSAWVTYMGALCFFVAPKVQRRVQRKGPKRSPPKPPAKKLTAKKRK